MLFGGAFHPALPPALGAAPISSPSVGVKPPPLAPAVSEPRSRYRAGADRTLAASADVK